MTPTTPTTLTRAGVARGARATWPLAVTAAAYGLVFGMLARQAGLSRSTASWMSALVSAGGSQFVALGLWRAPLPVAAIVFTTFVVNLRHVLMGATLRPWLRPLPARTMYSLAFFISDESWTLTTCDISGGGRDAGFLLGSGLTLFPAWVGSTAAGHLLGTAVPAPARWGLDFAFTAVFAALLVGMWQGRTSLWPWASATTVALLTERWLPGQWYIVLAGGAVGAIQHDL